MTLERDFGGALVGTEVPIIPGDAGLLVGDRSVTFLGHYDATFSSGIFINGKPTTFNGVRIFDIDGTIDSFTALTIGPSNFVGLDTSHISFDADNIYLDFSGLTQTRTTSATVFISTVAAVPEPATWGLMILGIGLVGGTMRRRVRASEVRFNAKIKQISEGAAA